MHYVLTKDFNTFIYDHTSYRSRKLLCLYCLQPSSIEEILKLHIKDLKRMGKKDYEGKIKSPFIINADFQFILVAEDNGKQNPKACYTNKYRKDIVCSNGYKSVCLHNKFREPFNAYLGKDAV